MGRQMEVNLAYLGSNGGFPGGYEKMAHRCLRATVVANNQ